MEYASKGVANAGLTTGIIGTSLAGLEGLASYFGNKNQSESDKPVTRYEAALFGEIEKKDVKIAQLESEMYTDKRVREAEDKINARIDGVNAQLSQQAVYNATNTAMLGGLQGQVAQLQSLTKMVVPNASVCPGWGNVNITPATSGSNG
jgi:hypothetical protein